MTERDRKKVVLLKIRNLTIKVYHKQLYLDMSLS